MNKREMIERALGRYLKKGWVGRDGGHHSYDTQRALKALAELSIVIECDVEHRTSGLSNHRFSLIREKGKAGYTFLTQGHPLPEGKAFAIIVSVPPEAGSLEPVDDTRQNPI